MRRLLCLIVLLALPGLAGAQSSDYLRYYPAGGGGDVSTVQTNSTAVPTSGTLIQALHTLSLPAQSLGSAGDFVDLNATFVVAANGNSKTAAIRLTGTGGTVLITIGTTSSGISIAETVRCTRTGETTMLCFGAYNTTAVTGWTTSATAVTGQDFTAPIVFVLAGTSPNQAGDITATSSKLTLTK
jgi:hypothetical protein